MEVWVGKKKTRLRVYEEPTKFNHPRKRTEYKRCTAKRGV